MNIFLRTFNPHINSKTGAPLPAGKTRGTPEWLIFQQLLMDCIESLGHKLSTANEGGLNEKPFPMYGDRIILCHRTRRDEEAHLYWIQMHMRELFTIDPNGWGYDHSRRQEFPPHLIDAETARHFCQEKSDQFLASGVSKHDQPTQTGMTPPRFILVPIQIPRDYTIKHHSPITVKYFVDSIQAWAIETENHVCFKLHPCNTLDMDIINAVSHAADNSRYVHQVEGNIHELIKRSSGLFVINSGTGFESLIHGKPVATFGNCDYNAATFNADIRRLDEARNFLYSYNDSLRDVAYRYVYWYWKELAYDVYDAETPARLKKYLEGVL